MYQIQRTFLANLLQQSLKVGFNSEQMKILNLLAILPFITFPCAKKNEKLSSHLSTLKFKVAFITAGALRSFAFVSKSWYRQILTPWSGQILLFAHVIYDKRCPIDDKGLSVLKEMATDLEVSSGLVVFPKEYLQGLIPDKFKNYTELLTDERKGNLADMNARRARAYQLSLRYAKMQNISYDLFLFTRTDNAFYNPILNLFEWYSILRTLNNQSHERRYIYTPVPCNFYGICDRFLVGLPDEMDIYFRFGWLFETLNIISNEGILEYMKPIMHNRYLYVNGTLTLIPAEFVVNKRRLFNSMNSEVLSVFWLAYNNISQVDIMENRIFRPVTFLTLRVQSANSYCTLNRREFVSDNESPTALFFPDKLTSIYGGNITGSDDWVNPIFRCGHFSRMNVSHICPTNVYCNCNIDHHSIKTDR